MIRDQKQTARRIGALWRKSTMNYPMATKPTADTFLQRLQGFIHDIERETALLQRQNPRGRHVDIPEVSLLRVAHYALAGLNELLEMSRESRS